MILRKISVVVAILAVQAVARPVSAQQIAVQRLTAREIPAGLRIVGRVEGARRWTDRNGQNLLILTGTQSIDSNGNPATDREIHGYHFVRQGAGYRLLWHTVDFVKECDLDLLLEYAPGSLQVTDVDRDGIAETTYVYRLGCRGGLDPLDLKLILHEGATKYAIRGFEDYREFGSEYPAPEMDVEPSLASQPALRAFAVAQWRRFVRPSAWEREGAP